MNARRVEVTFSQKDWDRLERARGHEPRASFVKRALESALGGAEEPVAQSSGSSVAAPVRAPVTDDADEFAAGEVDHSPPSPKFFPGVSTARDVMWDRQQKLNKRGKK